MEILIDKKDSQNFELDELENDHAEEEYASKSIPQLKEHVQTPLTSNTPNQPGQQPTQSNRCI